MTHLFTPITFRDLVIRNRIVMAPMCMYTAKEDGIATDWHLAHYLARASGGVGLIITEATSVESRGRISPNDLGLWDDAQIKSLARIVELVHAEGAAIGTQLAHAGRKAWSRSRGVGLEQPVGPSAIPYSEEWVNPQALTTDDIAQLVESWRAAAIRAEQVGFDTIQIHAAHGYLVHEFLSPLSNKRTDEYGGSLENRARLLLEITEAIRDVWPDSKPLMVRISATDWIEGGLTPEDHVVLARDLAVRGVDLIDCSAGGVVSAAPGNVGPGFMVPFAEKIRRETGMPTSCVGLITEPEYADAIIRNGQADMVSLGRVLLRDPYWALEAARVLKREVKWPIQYERGQKP